MFTPASDEYVEIEGFSALMPASRLSLMVGEDNP